MFIATTPIDPAANTIQGFLRSNQEDAEAIASANSRPGQSWVVYELSECARTVADAPRLIRTKEPATRAERK